MDEFNSLNNIEEQFKKITKEIIDEARSVIRTSSYCLIEEQIKRLAPWILNISPQHTILIQYALEKYTGIFFTGIQFFPEATEGLFKTCLLFHPYIETQEKALTLSLTGQKYYIQLTLKYLVRVISKVVSDYNLTDIVIQKAVNRWKTETMIEANIKNILNSSSHREKSQFQPQDMENLYFTIANRTFFLFPKDLNRFIHVPIAFDQSANLLIQNAKDLSKDEKNIFINILFHEPYKSTEALVREMNIILADFFGYIKTPVRNFPTPVRVKKFIDDSNTPPKRPFSLSGEFTKETLKKRLSLEHIYLIKQASPEIELIAQAMKKSIRNAPINKRQKWGWEKQIRQEAALKCWDQKRNQFSLIEMEYLKDDKLYELLDSNRSNYQQELCGEILNKIFKTKGLDTFDKKVIYNKVIEIRENQ